MLNPRIEKRTDGFWWLVWDVDPSAVVYDLIINDTQHVQAGKGAAGAGNGVKLGVRPTIMPQVGSAYVTGYERAPDPSTPPATVFTVAMSIPNNATLTTPVEWSAKPSKPVTKVEFSIDGYLAWTENYDPYVFNGDGNKLDPKTLTNGPHVLSVVAYAPDGTTAQVSANVTASIPIPPPPPVPSGTAGRVGYFVDMGGGWADGYVNDASKHGAILDQWDGCVSWLPNMTSWYPRAIEYVNSMGDDKIGGECSDGPPVHAPFVLKNANGQYVFLDFKNSSCGKYARYAADVGSQGWRDYIVSRVKNSLARGFTGVMLDDVNLAFRFVGTPIDPRTGQPMTSDHWKDYFCGMLEYVRKQVPSAVILHNAIWFSGPNHDGLDIYTQRQAGAANFVMYEFGFTDGGLTGGTGEWSYHRLMKNMDSVHAAGAKVWVMSHGANTLQAAELNLAGALLTSVGGDMNYSEYGHNPSSFWKGYEIDLGAPKSDRLMWNGVWRRDFEKGVVLLNEPGATTKTLQVAGRRIDGTVVAQVTLPARAAAVILT